MKFTISLSLYFSDHVKRTEEHLTALQQAQEHKIAFTTILHYLKKQNNFNKFTSLSCCHG